MSVLLTVHPKDHDLTRDLGTWLLEERYLRGEVTYVHEGVPEGAMGAVVEGVQVALGSGGAVAALAGVVIAWLRTRPGEVTLKIKRGTDEIELTGKGVKALDARSLRELTERVTEIAAKSLSSDDHG